MTAVFQLCSSLDATLINVTTRAKRSEGRKDGTRFRGSDSDAGTAGPDSECSREMK